MSTESQDPDFTGFHTGQALLPLRVDGRRRARQERWTFVVYCAIAYVFVATFPGRLLIPQPGLDSSWAFAVNVIPHFGRGFGSELAFTWGPLAHLAIPMDVNYNFLRALLFWTATQAIVVVVLIHRFQQDREPFPVLGFIVGYLIAYSFGAYFEYQVILVVGLLLTVTSENGLAWRLGAASAGILTGVLLFMKLSTGLSALSLVAIAGLMWALRGEVRIRDVAVFLWAPALAAILTLGMLTMGGVGEFVGWLLLSVDMSAGYAVAMSGENLSLLLALSLIAASLLIGLIVVLSRVSPRTLSLGVAFLVPVYLALRHSFVRHNGRFVGPVILGVASLLILQLRSPRSLLAGAIGFSALLLPVGLISASGGCGCAWNPALITPAAGLSTIADIVEGSSERGLNASLSNKLLSDDTLPTHWVQTIGGRTVDVIPWETSIVPANQLRWIPGPTIQTYQIVTPRLDRIAARHFAGLGAPDFLIIEYGDIDYRHALWGAPRMWRSILSHYAPSDVRSWENRVLFERRPGPPADLRPVAFLRESVMLGKWHPVPTRDGGVFAHIEFAPTLFGHLAILFWQVPPLHVDVKYVDGQIWTYRILPTTAGAGVLMSPLPREEWELLDWMHGDPAAPVVQFRIRGSGTSLYRDPIQVTWANAGTPTI
jgi:hypothetical protein